MGSRLRLFVALLGLVFFASHVRTLPHTLEDMDSINFALGVEKFDVSSHRPHPPGYPVYIALGKISTAALGAAIPSWDRDHRAAAGLALLGLVAGTLAAAVLTKFWIAVGMTPPIAFLAAVLAIVSPLFWFTAARPLTDTPALVGSIWIQAQLLGGLRAVRATPAARLPRTWLWTAFGAGLLIGVRTQTMWLTGPLLLWCTAELCLRRRWRDAAVLVGAAAIGALVWAVPLVWNTGGFARYVALLGSQGAADFQGVEMLATSPTWRLLKTAVFRTFMWPWTAPLAYVVIAAALVGLVRVGKEKGFAIAAVMVSYLPYLIFHVSYQETVTLRYALPLIVPVAGLAVVGLAELRSRMAVAGAVAALAVASLAIAQPRLEAYSLEGSAVFRGFQDMARAAPSLPDRPVLRMHHQVWWGVQRELDWFRPMWEMGPQPFPGSREWLAMVADWRSGSARPTWFLTDATRTDVALFDWRSRILRGQYSLRAEVRTLMKGPRLEELNWWEIRRPGWMLGNGWALTPEIAGMTMADQAAPHQRPAEAFLQRQSAPMLVLIGGRYLAPAGSPDAILTAELDGRPLTEWRVTSAHPWFTQWIELPEGTGASPGPYATLTVHVTSATPGGRAPLVGLEQFDAARTDEVITAFSDGWHEPEEDPHTGRFWRWTSDRSTLTVRGATRDVTLTIGGELPPGSSDHPPTVVIRAGDREIARFEPNRMFSREIPVPAAALVGAGGGMITIETSQTFVPAEHGQGEDRRKLGLKLSRVEVR